MTDLLERYLSFHGRVARLPFFIRALYLNIAAAVITFASIPLFMNGGRVLWWAGLVVLLASLLLLFAGTVSLIVRRLHDLNLSGYHVIWAGAAEACWVVLTYGPPKGILYGLPVGAISFWLTFWPGTKSANRFGAVPE
jgi:uncharacterized membrane protein YhaH (DUF805 family)